MKFVLKLMFLSIVLVSCEKNLLEEEHYKNIIYLKSDENNTFPYLHAMNDSVSRGYLTVGSGGSMPLTNDVIVTLEVDTSILNQYNYRNFGTEYNKYIQMVKPNLYVLPSNQIIIKKGDPAAVTFFPIEIDANELSPDTTYMIPFRIVHASGYEVNPEKDIILYKPELGNQYTASGSRLYKMKGTKKVDGSTLTSSITTTKTILPLGRNRVRLFPENISSSSSLADIQNKTIVLIINDDNSVIIKSYRNIEVEQIDKSSYDPKLKRFTLSYRYKLPGASNWTTLLEILDRVE